MTRSYLGPCAQVPFFSQHDARVEAASRHEFCGLMSLYMVLCYWSEQQQKAAPSLAEVSDYALSIDGLDEEHGWLHTKLAETARHFGYPAVARSWFRRPSDLAAMRKQQRLGSDTEEQYYTTQVNAEFLVTLRRLLVEDIPVILSVKAGFGANGTNHLVVVTGIDPDGEHVLVHDPQYHNETGKNREVAAETLLQFSNFNAIVVYDETV